MSAYSDLMASLSPVAWWRLGEASGNFADSSGNGLTLTAVATGSSYGADGAIAGDTDKAFTMAQTAGDGGFLADTSAPSPTTALTLVVWFKYAGSSGTGRTMIRRGAGAVSWFIDRHTTNAIRGYINTTTWGGYTMTGSVISDTDWHMTALTYQHGVRVRLYLDGAQDVDGGYFIGDLTYDTSDLGIGSVGDWWSLPWNGSLDEVAIWDSPLSATDVSDLWEAGTVTETTGTFAMTTAGPAS